MGAQEWCSSRAKQSPPSCHNPPRSFVFMAPKARTAMKPAMKAMKPAAMKAMKSMKATGMKSGTSITKGALMQALSDSTGMSKADCSKVMEQLAAVVTSEVKKTARSLSQACA